MNLTSVRRFLHSQQGMALLLAFTLWLPVEQLAAATHALLHLPAAAERAGHPPSPCNTCVVAAAVLSAAPLAETAANLPRAAAPAQPEPEASVLPPLAPPASYDSRAPPLLHA